MALIERHTVAPENVDDGKLTAEAIVAGAVATLVTTVFFAAAPLVGLPAINPPHLLGNMMAGHTATWAIARVFAWIVYFGLGVGLAAAYAWGVQRQNPRAGVREAIVFCLAPFMAIQVFVLPAFRQGAFGVLTAAPVGQFLTGLIATLIYAAIMGTLVRVQVLSTALPRLEHRRSIA